MKSKIIFGTILILVIVIVGYNYIFKGQELPYEFAEVKKGNVSQEISETGQVKKGEEIKLGFKNIGRIEKIYVEVGQAVESGTFLVKLDTGQLYIQFQEAKASLDLAEAKLAKLLAGASQEEIALAETKVVNASTSLRNVKQNLVDVKAVADENLKNFYEDALNTLDDAYIKICNAFNVVDLIQRDYFYYSDQESQKVKESKTVIKTAKENVKFYLDIAKDDSNNENIDTALSEMKSALEKVSERLAVVRDVTEESAYRNTVSDTDKTSLDTQKSNINTALTDIVDSQQTISSGKLTNQSNVNTAQSEVSTAEGALQTAQDELALKKAEPQQVEIDLYQVQIRQAQAKVALLQEQIQEATLKSPVKGQITEINKREGETIQITGSIISLIPATPFQVETDIYEEDIVKVKIENPVDITLAAFSDEILKGKVISIDPAERLIGGVVYYKVIIDFEDQRQGIKPGMTADLVIKTAFKENVLIVSEDAIQKKNGKFIVQVFKDDLIEDREIEIGLKGSDGNVEIISGLLEGEQVIIE